jgi:hypothetical protein
MAVRLSKAMSPPGRTGKIIPHPKKSPPTRPRSHRFFHSPINPGKHQLF